MLDQGFKIIEHNTDTNNYDGELKPKNTEGMITT